MSADCKDRAQLDPHLYPIARPRAVLSGHRGKPEEERKKRTFVKEFKTDTE